VNGSSVLTDDEEELEVLVVVPVDIDDVVVVVVVVVTITCGWNKAWKKLGGRQPDTEDTQSILSNILDTGSNIISQIQNS